MNIFVPTSEQNEIVSMVWECDCQYRMAIGGNPKRVFLSREALMPFNSPKGFVVTGNGETEITINDLDIFYDPTLIGKACYCRK